MLRKESTDFKQDLCHGNPNSRISPEPFKVLSWQTVLRMPVILLQQIPLEFLFKSQHFISFNSLDEKENTRLGTNLYFTVPAKIKKSQDNTLMACKLSFNLAKSENTFLYT